MPHPLPEDINAVEGLKWFLVAVPDDPAYTRAAMDVYTELANYWKWGKEGPVPVESDQAAQHWSNAVYETIEALQMGFPDILLGYIDQVEELLLALQGAQSISVDCCGNLAPVDETATSEIVEGVGDPPADWGEEPVVDWDDWHELVCGAAHAYVDLLISMAAQLDTLLTVGAIGIGIVAGILGLLAGAGILLAISYGAAAGVVSALADAVGSAVFSSAEAEIEAARDDIVCGVFLGDLGAQVEAAVSATAWTLFFQFIDYESARNVMLEGDHGAETLEVNRRTDCNCEFCFDEYSDLGSSFDGDGFWTLSSGSPNPDSCTVYTVQGSHLVLAFPADTVPCARYATLVATVERYRVEANEKVTLQSTYTPTTSLNIVETVPCDEDLVTDVITEVSMTLDLDLVPTEHNWAIRLTSPQNDFGIVVYETRLFFHD